MGVFLITQEVLQFVRVFMPSISLNHTFIRDLCFILMG